ncbi:MAG: hypothetical protein ACTSRW_02300 [Candidatus Helarchaeota archaeon]
MPNCPECAGYMKFDRDIRLYVCQRCGLSLRRSEIDDLHEKRKEIIMEERDEDEIRRSKHKEYLDWYLNKKE